MPVAAYIRGSGSTHTISGESMFLPFLLSIVILCWSSDASVVYVFLGVITYWSTSSPSFLVGGITYSNGALTVPSDGIYYIYVQLRVYKSRGIALPFLRVNGGLVMYMYYQMNDGERTKYSGIIQSLKKGDSVDVVGNGNPYYMHYQYSYFGMFKMN